jgi:cytoskeletal protein RodZ
VNAFGFSRSAGRIAVGILGLVACGLLFACSSSASDDDGVTTPVEATPTADTTADTSSGGGSQSSDPAPSSPTPSDPTPTDTATPTGPAPVIDSFDTPENIDCHNGNDQTFTASWTTTNATEVLISIDGAGPSDTYEPNASTSLPFDCSSSHTFLLTARSADGQETWASVTLDPRNVQVPAGDAELDEPTDEQP